jgi:hypothetical protein
MVQLVILPQVVNLKIDPQRVSNFHVFDLALSAIWDASTIASIGEIVSELVNVRAASKIVSLLGS